MISIQSKMNPQKLLVVHSLWKNSVALSYTLKIGTPYDNVIPFLRIDYTHRSVCVCVCIKMCVYVCSWRNMKNDVMEALYGKNKIPLTLQ